MAVYCIALDADTGVMHFAGSFRYSGSIVAILAVDDGTFVDVNAAFEREIGYARHEVIGRPTIEIGLWPDPQIRASIWGKLRVQRHVAAQTTPFMARDGTYKRGLLSCELFEHEGRSYVFSMLQDVQLADAIPAERSDVESYRALFAAAAEGIFRSLPLGDFIDVNPAAARIFGFDTPAQMLTEGRGGNRRYADAETARRAHRELALHDRLENWPSQVRRRDGSLIWVSENARVVRDETGRIMFHEGTLVDITEKRAAEAALRQSEARYKALVDKYRELFEQSPVGLFRTRPDGAISEVNPMLAQMLGFDSPDALKHRFSNMFEVYADPAERPRLVERLMRDGAFRDHQTQVRRCDGTCIWVEVSVRAYRQPDGTVSFEGSVQDISERRATEQALQRSEAKYRTLVEHAQVGVFISRGDRYVYLNHALAAMLGYAEAELLELDHRALTAPEFLDAARDRHELRESGLAAPTDYESCMLRKDGSRVYVTVSIGPLVLDGVMHRTGTVRDITRHRHVEQRLKFHATHDSLTGLPNRLMFQQHLGEAIKRARAEQRFDYAVLFLDLDGFKLVNDSLGHAVGDRLLVVIAEKLTVAMAGEALVARYGGDEFTMLPLGACSRDRAAALADRVLGLFDASFDIGGHQVFSGTSVGIVLGRAEYRSPDQVLRDADTAMYRAKAGGKSAYVVFDEAMHAAARTRYQLELDLRLALEREEFRVYYQPIVTIATGAIVGFEALLRWEHPQRGLLLPDAFLTVAEEAGLVTEIDWWVLEQACGQLADWRRRHPQHAASRMNVNVDERQLAARNLVEELAAVLDRARLDASALALEVTETIFRNGRGRAGATLANLKSLGVILVVDDFGTGYSSLDSFAASPFDALKIDRGFVHDMETNRRHRAIVRTITAFAEDLGLALTAEGVETEAQAQLLAELGCVTAQGFLYAHPLPAAQIEAMLAAPRELLASPRGMSQGGEP